MAAVAVRALAVLALLAGGGARAARFGDRLAPRLAPRLPAPHVPTHYVDYDDTAYDHTETEEEEPPETEPPPRRPARPEPRRPARTEAHRLEMSTEYFVIPEKISSSSTSPPPSSSTAPSRVPVVSSTIPPVPRGALRSEPWAVPILSLACVCMLILGAFEAFVVWGARRTAPSRRHLLLGQALLLGLFASAATAGLYAATPTAFTCGAVRFATGASYALVFASLLVKCVFLLSLNGGVYLPAAYQGLLLFFAVMIQVAIGAQWLGGAPPRVDPETGRCSAPLSDLLLSLCYAAFLIAVVCGVALRSRGIRDNYREATHIAGAGGAAAAVWACWVAAALGSPERDRDACLAAGLLATCAVVFALMFAPKGRRLAALGRESGRSAAGAASLGGSGYSPSFFHFKPVKYGMVSAAASPPERKEPARPADVWWTPRACPHYFPPLLHYHNYPPYHFYLPPGVVLRPEEGVYTSVAEPTLSANPNVYFHRSSPLHVGMMY